MSRRQSGEVAIKNNLLSIVVPVFNEADVLPESTRRILDICSHLPIRSEIIFVNDGSTDQTLEILIRIAHSNSNIRVITFTENRGHMFAMTAGLEAAKGDFVLTIDADLQDPPEMIPELLNCIQTPDSRNLLPDVVQTYRQDRTSDSYFKRYTAQYYYKLLRTLTGMKIVPHAADFRIMTKETVRILLELPEQHKIYRLLIPKLGFRTVYFPIVRSKRYSGTTKYNIPKMFYLGLSSIISFSFVPLRIFSVMALVISAILGISILPILFIGIFLNPVNGWTSLVFLILVLNTFLFLSIGVLSEYIARIFELQQRRPSPRWEEVERNG